MRGKAPLQKEAVLELLADRYKWPWEEIKKIPASELRAILEIIKVKDTIKRIDAGAPAKRPRK